MTQSPLKNLSIVHHFAALTDPRVRRTRQHCLNDIIVIAICGFVCGCKSWEQVAIYGRQQADWFRTFLELPNGIPSKDTFRRVFARIKPYAFERCFRSWVKALAETLGIKHIAIDGKTARRSHDRGAGKAALHLVSAWAAENHLTLGQVACAAKSNEITAIPQLLELLELAGAIVTIDAMGCQKEIAAKIRAGGGHYLLAVKDNQPNLLADIQQCFQTELDKPQGQGKFSEHQTTTVGHGRVEQRLYYTIDRPQGLRDLKLWKDLRTITMVVSERQQKGAEPTVETRYYIGSKALQAKANGRYIRGHWGIENTLHWTLDMVFDEDRNRTRKGHGPENIALLRRLAISILKNDTRLKTSLPTKQFHALLDHRVLERMLVEFSGK
jgi:predicted transposase YbfD/YdcC